MLYEPSVLTTGTVTLHLHLLPGRWISSWKSTSQAVRVGSLWYQLVGAFLFLLLIVFQIYYRNFIVPYGSVVSR